MNAFNTVNLAAACILTSTQYATELGVPREKWIYPLGGAGTSDCHDCKALSQPNPIHAHPSHQFQPLPSLSPPSSTPPQLTHPPVLHRPNYFSSPALTATLSTTLSTTSQTASSISLYDLYACFPIVPKLACEQLNLPITGGTKPLTVLGGLTSFGGAGNGYSMHVS